MPRSKTNTKVYRGVANKVLGAVSRGQNKLAKVVTSVIGSKATKSNKR